MYFLAYFIKNIQKVNIVGARDSNVRPKTYGTPCTHGYAALPLQQSRAVVAAATELHVAVNDRKIL